MISRGSLQIRLKPVDVGNTIADALEAVEAILKRKGHRLSFEMPVQPMWVEGDSIRLTQAFQNLLTNAATYTPHHGKIPVAPWGWSTDG